MDRNARWVRDASVTAVDLVVTAALLTGAALLHARWLAAVGVLWALLTLRQGYLAARVRGRPARAPDGTRHRPRR
ncbi:hypothetical protein [Streptomyces celluloflavus]|uniref:hypothetical protein n=1 Tax=Streptomyces celluloflavus TaxID=58344 RepID=UPI0036A2165E